MIDQMLAGSGAFYLFLFFVFGLYGMGIFLGYRIGRLSK